jgi:hypothetical protein
VKGDPFIHTGSKGRLSNLSRRLLNQERLITAEKDGAGEAPLKGLGQLALVPEPHGPRALP